MSNLSFAIIIRRRRRLHRHHKFQKWRDSPAIFASMTNSIHRMEFKVIISLAIQFLSVVRRQWHKAATNINNRKL